VRDSHAALMRTLGAEATVLWKNLDNTLPLQAPMNIGVFGNDAAHLSTGLYDGRKQERKHEDNLKQSIALAASAAAVIAPCAARGLLSIHITAPHRL
jgi:hypothetical protein